MPTYELECGGCGYEQEIVLPITQAPSSGQPRRCPKCGHYSLAPSFKTAPVICDAKLRFDAKYPYVSHRHAAGRLSGVNHTDGEGNPVIESASHERNVAAASGLVIDRPKSRKGVRV